LSNPDLAERRKVKSLLGVEAIADISSRLWNVSREFSRKEFVKRAEEGLADLSLMERANHIAHAIHLALPLSCQESLSVLVQALGPPRLEPGYGPDENFRVLPLTRFVSLFGQDHFDEAMRALYEMTRRFTSEFDIRPFLVRYPDLSLAQLRVWAGDPDMHVRRLVSEGTRARLPWATYLNHFRAEPRPVIELLNMLKDDPTEYVRKSVANNLCDISKDHPQLVFDTLSAWSRENTSSRRWIITHALRNLCQEGNVHALRLAGLPRDPSVRLREFRLSTRNLKLGENVTVTYKLFAGAKGPRSVVVHHVVRRQGSIASRPYKVCSVLLNPGAIRSIERTHSFAPKVTRKIAPGLFEIRVVVNGTVVRRSTCTVS